MTKPFARLPTCVAPSKYFLDYVVDLDRCRFEVRERVQLVVREATSVITCHALGLHVLDVCVSVAGRDAPPIACLETHYVAADQTVELLLAEPLAAGADATLALTCLGELNDELHGFYRSAYEHGLAGETRLMAVTQFEACDARRAFACWDEPALKAKFEISIACDAELSAISNTHVVQTLVRPRALNAHVRALSRPKAATLEKLWRFAETPVMSTYLVGMIVGEFDSVSTVTKEGVLVTVYTPVGRSERGKFALDVGAKALSFYSERFGIPYPLKKMDMLAIPDFAAGAMENWGVVTYRETRLLIDEQLSSFGQKMATARTVCHEIAHQWFGNLVTMEWWTGLWLNEGFARFMEFEAVHHVFPEWNVWEVFVQDITMSIAMGKDCMLTSHPIEVKVNHPDEVDQIFDVISYAKGASVIRMLSEYLGRDVFYRGIHEYLVKFSYRNAQTQDLWEALEEASGQHITSLASGWTSQTGYPMVTLSEDGALAQKRFLADQTLKAAASEGVSWDVPITFIASDKPKEIQRVGIWERNSSSDALATKLRAPSSGWIKLNAGQAGFFLVNYSPEGWKRLQQPVSEKTLGPVDRMSLLNSIFAFARSGELPVSRALDFSFAYAEEPEHLCWKEISSNLRFYSTLYSADAFYPKLQAYIRQLFSSIMKRLTWQAAEGETSTLAPFRRDVISMLALGDDPEVIAESQRLFQAYFEDSSALSADLRGVVFNAQARRGDASHLKLLRERYESSNFIEEKLDCLTALGLFKSLELKREVITWGLKNVRSQDIQYVFSSVAADAPGAEFAWKYVQEHWAVLNEQYRPLIVGRIVMSVVSRFQSDAHAHEVEVFLETRKHSSYTRLLDAALERIRVKSACYQRSRDELAKWLESI
ncbi:Puromycin-sensitive aminopeptidase [Phytophthora fragariae]|uniref:Aminopeptidase n=1 Tax=Phytophthora fragariae TaxID=53985 RepID=A0A6A3EPH7_9STRA|nr:Puromycin-sensitive aminopeptidase [Phytophthora fragariae]KAE8983978.1 Puromycin-sensitive aminopeptidase [Phytophthora fragariae]KAE9092221.1 Puromycin-sensitive aminopeptidase [Phytophthora fragariae]KAE9102328.1 Puromycin-sensitive aminopeptidase [Phytophthora fragariae]KAE9202761.1 Puromycin-sensitive aminopeptidase [Phytophthora fragariae]